MEKSREEEIRFITNPKNIGKCDECPRNLGFERWGGNLPCGQQNCWIEIICNSPLVGGEK